MGKKVNLKNVGITRKIFNDLCKMPYEKVNEYFEYELCECVLSRQHKGAEAFVRIPIFYINRELKTEIEKITMFLHIMLFTYGGRWKKIKFKPSEFMDLFGIKIAVKELRLMIENEYEYIKINYDRIDGFTITPNIKIEEDEKDTFFDKNEGLLF